MSSLNFLLLTSFFFLLTLDLCSPSAQNGPGPTGPLDPTGPTGSRVGFDCTFRPVTGFGPDPTDPTYNAALVSDYSVSEFIQCANETSTLVGNDEIPSRIQALDVLVHATMKCGQNTLSGVIQNYSKTDRKMKLTRYLCGKASDSDVCSLSRCLGVKFRENTLKGICQDDNIDLKDNPPICDISGGDNGEPATITDMAGGMATASSSITVAQETASNNPAGSPSTSLSSSSNATSKMLAAGFGELIAAGVVLIVLMASL